MQTIKDTVGNVLKDIRSRRSEREIEVSKLWKRNLSGQERLHTKCVSLRQEVLTVHVDSSAWLYQVNQKKEKLVTKLGVKDIRLRLGEVGEK